MARENADDLHRSIEEFIKGGFDAGDIMSVKVDDDRVRDEIAVLDITVVFRGTPSDFAQKGPLGFLSKLRAHVDEAYHAFPVVRFRPAPL
ncbi:hypothetical protein ACYQR9_02750 [Methylobacterium sp. CM6241]